jgi:hypothetical protein
MTETALNNLAAVADPGITIRLAGVFDLPDIARRAEEFHLEFLNRPGIYKFDPEMFLLQWIDWLHLPNYVLIGAFERGTFIAGIGGVITCAPYSRDLMGQELFWYVCPEYRDSMAGIRVLKRFEKWVKVAGAKYWMMGYLHGSEASEKVSKLYKKMGFVPLETHVIKEI